MSVGTVLTEFQFDKPKNSATQIADYLRQQILKGRIPPGQKLPSTQQLAVTWTTHVPTVHAALARLTKEGLLTRHHRKATFVSQPEQRLQRLGIYYQDSAIWIQPTQLFMRTLHGWLSHLAQDSKIDCSTWVDSRPVAQQTTPWEKLTKAIEDGDVQAVVMVPAAPVYVAWAEQLPVPVSFLGGATPRCVKLDGTVWVETAIRALHAQGCRTVGVISTYHSRATPFNDQIIRVCQELGIQIRNEWIAVNSEERVPAEHELFGYQQFHKLWQNSERPDGLAITDDFVARGAISAILEAQVRVPGDLKLALHRNVEVGLMCPFPAQFIDLSCREVADGLLEQLRRQFRGETCTPIPISFHVATS